MQHSTDPAGDPSLVTLALTAHQRVDRALRARDSFHAALNRSQDNDSPDDALFWMDAVLTQLMGAVDAVNRVAHRVLELDKPNETAAGWQRRDWRDAFQAACPELAVICEPGSDHFPALTILRRLRNTVHGEALAGLGVRRAGGPERNLVGLPPEHEGELLAAMDTLGGRTSWGVEVAAVDRVYGDPGVLVERLLRTIVPVLNDLMCGTPLESLAGVSLGPEDAQPRASPDASMQPQHLMTSQPFDPWVRASIRWQVGLGLPEPLASDAP